MNVDIHPKLNLIGDHSLSTFVTFSEKLTFLTPDRYTHVTKVLNECSVAHFRESGTAF